MRDNHPNHQPASSEKMFQGKQRRVLFVTDFYVEEALEGIVNYARDADWELIANMRFHGKFPSEAEADGILATASGERVQTWLQQWYGCPIVQMISAEPKLNSPIVTPDYTEAARIGVAHLLELGHVHFAFYWLEKLESTASAIKIFDGVLEKAGRRTHHLDFPAAFPGELSDVPREERFRWLVAELRRLPKPIAVMGDDDRRALEVLKACDLAGLRVPEDVAILGCDNRAIDLGLARIPLSSIDMNFRGVGWEAASRLDQLMQGKSVPAEMVHVTPNGVVARRSTATFVTDSPAITAAVLHLREHFDQPLRLAKLAGVAHLSERVFEMEFKRHVGCTVRDELRRVRLAAAERLLRDTDFKLEAIAMESGFGSARRLCAVFGEAHGVSPNVWRQKAGRIVEAAD